MNKIFLKIAGVITLLASPLITIAATGPTLAQVMTTVVGYFQSFVTLIIGLAVLTFVWNVYLYFFTEKDKKEAGLYVLYSVIGFFVIFSLWGLVNIFKNSLELNNAEPTWPFGAGGNGQSQGVPLNSGTRVR